MKKYINSLIGLPFFLFAFFLFSCESDLDKTTITPKSQPGNVTVDNNEAFVCTEENSNDVAYEFSWSKADFGENISAAYYLQFDLEGNNFSSPAEMIAGNNIFQKTVVSSELNMVMHKLLQPIDMATDIEVRVMAKPMVTGASSPEIPELVSDSKVKINLTSYAMAPVHIIGSLFDNYWEPGGDVNFWNIYNYQYVMFRDDPLADDVHVGFCKYADDWAAGKFKIINDKNLGTNTMIGKEGNGVLAEDGKGANIEDLTAEGYYKITVSVAKSTYSIEPYDASSATEYEKVELTGNGQDIELAQSHYDSHIWIVDDVMLTTGNVTFKLDGSGNWGATTFPWGKSTLNGESIYINRDGNYFIKFNDLTGHYIFYRKKQ